MKLSLPSQNDELVTVSISLLALFSFFLGVGEKERVGSSAASLRVLIRFCSPEPWYGTRYKEMPLKLEALARWTQGLVSEQGLDLYLPAKNPFIPESLELVSLDPTISEEGKQRIVPIKLIDDDFGEVWFKPDTRFKLPKGLVYIQIFSSIAYSSPKNACLCRLFSMLVDDHLNEIAYYADVAGLHYSIRNTKDGLKVRCQPTTICADESHLRIRILSFLFHF